MMEQIKRRLQIGAMTVITVFLLAATAAQAKEVPFATKSHAYVVMDANSGKILYKKKPNKQIYPASTAKLMTAVIAMENNDPDKVFTIRQSDYDELPSDIQHLNLPIGQRYSLNELLHTMLIFSDGSSALTLSHQTTGSEPEFLRLMNKKAQDLGLPHTTYDNPIGMDIGNNYHHTRTTAKEMAKLTRYAMGKQLIREIVAKPAYQLPSKTGGSGIDIQNTNLFYSTRSDYRKDLFTIIGTKTGTTNAAGFVLIATAVDEHGHEVICAYFGKKSSQNTYSAVNRILTYTFRTHKKGELDLSDGCYDMRDSEYADLVNQYLENGSVEPLEDGGFHPDDPATEEEFLNVWNKITGQKMQGGNAKTITVERLKQLYFIANPVTGYQNSAEKTEMEQTIWEQKAPEEYRNNPGHCLTRLDMVRIADHMKK